MNAAVLTVSDGVSAGVREDLSGDALEELLRGEGFSVERRVVADDADAIGEAIRDLVDGGSALVLTTGGTGFAPRDVTPEATRSVVDREAPGLAEAIRADARARTPHALLSRGVAGRQLESMPERRANHGEAVATTSWRARQVHDECLSAQTGKPS